MKIKNTLRTIKQEIRNFIFDKRSRINIPLDENEKRILMNIKTKGYHVIPNFYSTEECKILKKEIDSLLEKYETDLFTDNQKSDHRIFGADRLSPLINKFYSNEFIDKIVKSHEKTKNVNGLTMAAKLDYKPGNLGSGGGWHRDWAVDKQIKAIVYLTDVDDTSGPFQYIENSHRHLDIIIDTYKNNFEFNQNRFTDREIEVLLTKKDPSKLKTITGKAGMLLLANTRGLHRGMPIKDGIRYAMTNYYWSNMQIPNHVAKLIIKNK